MLSHKLKIFGYSERGMINSILYSIACNENSLEKFHELLKLIEFPYQNIKPFQDISINNVKVLIEQSLSEFGTADIIILLEKDNTILEKDNTKSIIFIEAKIKGWHFDTAFKDFEDRKCGTSNLFFQLYLKQRFVNALNKHKIANIPGIDFSFGTIGKRNIGKHPVVIETAKNIMNYCEKDAFFVALLPDNPKTAGFFKSGLIAIKNEPEELNFINWGYITWESIETTFKSIGNIDECFEHNEGQIYKRPLLKA